jgi:Spy/CpxP family protein refolding chaperone
MVRVRSLLGVIALSLISALIVQAQMGEQSESGSTRAGATTRPARLVLPWNLLTSLTEEQKTQIRQIHREALDAITKIEQKEEADILNLLTDEQRMELKAATEAKAAQDRARRSAAREANAGGAAGEAAAEEAVAEQAAETAAPARP